jgi:signal transduction histidine kinase
MRTTYAGRPYDLPFDLGFADLSPRPGDIRALCRSAVAAVKIDHPDRWISHRLHRSGDGAGCWDADQVLQLLSALLEHALVRGSPHAPVSLEWRGSDEDVTVEVEYEPRSGSGDPGEVGDHELGLGPLVASAIARAHGGLVEVSRTRFGSLRWTVRLPRAQGARHAGATESETSADAAAGAP